MQAFLGEELTDLQSSAKEAGILAKKEIIMMRKTI